MKNSKSLNLKLSTVLSLSAAFSTCVWVPVLAAAVGSKSVSAGVLQSLNEDHCEIMAKALKDRLINAGHVNDLKSDLNSTLAALKDFQRDGLQKAASVDVDVYFYSDEMKRARADIMKYGNSAFDQMGSKIRGKAGVRTSREDGHFTRLAVAHPGYNESILFLSPSLGTGKLSIGNRFLKASDLGDSELSFGLEEFIVGIDYDLSKAASDKNGVLFIQLRRQGSADFEALSVTDFIRGKLPESCKEMAFDDLDGILIGRGESKSCEKRI